MRPVRLIMEGFGTFRDRVEIDFSSAEFFALVGPTGSGKSTVIDAMCFALYGSVPRYDDKGAVAPTLSTGANQARVQLSFTAGGQFFNAVRVVQRTARGATTKEARLELVTQEGGAERLDTKASGASDVTKAVESLLGLTFEHFTRCVVLPQGDFAKFLHDTPKDRQDVLVKLLQLDIYKSMMQAANARAASAGEELRTLTARLEELGDISQESIEALRSSLQELDDLEAKLAPIANRLEAVQAEGVESSALRKALDLDAANLRSLAVPTSVRELADSLASTKQLMEQATLDLEAAEQRQREANEAVARFPDPSELRGQLRDFTELVAVETTLADLGQQIEDALLLADSAQARAASAESELNEKRALIEPVSELTRAVEAHRLLAELAIRFEGAVSTRQRAVELSEELTSAIDAKTSTCDRIVLTAQTRPILERLQQLVAARDEASTNAEELQAASEVCQDELASAETISTQTMLEVENCSLQLRLVERNHVASTLAASLHAGDECPVCHNVVGDLPSHIGDAEVAAAQEALRASQRRHESASEDVNKLRSQHVQRIESLRVVTTSFEQVSSSIELELSAQAAALDPILNVRIQSGRLRGGELTQEAIANALAEVASAEGEVRRLESEIGELRAQAERARLTEARSATEIATLNERTTELQAQVREYPNLEAIEERIALAKQHEGEAATAEKRLRDLQTQAIRFRESLAKLEGSFDSLRNRYQSLLARCSGYKPVEELQSDLESAELAVTALQEATRTVGRQANDLKSMQSILLSFAQQEAAAIAEFHESRDRVARLLPPPFTTGALSESWKNLVDWASDQIGIVDANIQSLVEKISGLANERTTLRSERASLINQTIGSALADQSTNQDVEAEVARARAEQSTKLETIERNRGRAATLTEAKQQQQEVADVASELGRLLSAKRFEGWLVNTALRSLTVGASQILERLSGNEYALEVTEANEFQVVDHRNADQRRPVRSLSGGETFQASLALALALSQQIGGLSAQPGRSLDSIFLDEGFGTLDPTTLDMVANTIETLGRDGRMVGIITHVQELAERVPVRFHVAKGDRTSTVTMESSFQ